LHRNEIGDQIRSSGGTGAKWPLRAAGQWDAGRDDQRFLAALPLDRGNLTAITVIMNWQAALKKEVEVAPAR